MSTVNRLFQGLRVMPRADRWLLGLCFTLALIALALGVVCGALVGLTRAGFTSLQPAQGYRLLSLHGVTIFFYWLYFVQIGLLLALLVSYTEGVKAVAWRGGAWLGLVLMGAGFVSSQWGAASPLALLYDAPPELASAAPGLAAPVYIGYLMLSAGLFLMAASAMITAFKPRLQGLLKSWSVISFACVSWAGLLMVSAIAAMSAFLPLALWSLGWRGPVAEHASAWHVLFHNMHYLPLMATVIVWYVLVEALTGVKSIFGPRFSKMVFALYLLLVPPTSLYHMFLEPALPAATRALGSLLSLFISVPTVLVFLILVCSLEVHARANGARGLFGWIRALPWSNPAMAALGMAVLNLSLGGALSFVLIQERLAPLLSDTFFVPGYFHFLTVGTVSLSFLAALLYLLPALCDRPLRGRPLLLLAPYTITTGLLLFGVGGVSAGYLGVPRRMFDISYEGAAPAVWSVLLVLVGIGAVLMTLGLLFYLFSLGYTVFAASRNPAPESPELSGVNWGGQRASRTSAWVGPLAVAALVSLMMALSILSFELLQSLPLIGSGGGGH